MARMKQRKVLAAVVTCAVVGGVGTILLFPRAACACLTPAMAFDSVFGVDPVDASDSEIDTAVQRRLPIGTPAAAAEQALEPLTLGIQGGQACARSGSELRCESELEASPLGLHRHGVRLTLRFDEHEQLSDVSTERTRSVFGADL